LSWLAASIYSKVSQVISCLEAIQAEDSIVLSVTLVSHPLPIIFLNGIMLMTLNDKIYWLLGRRSRLSLSNKLLLYKSILKPIWTYGIQLWGTALPLPVDARTVVRVQPSHPSGPSNASRQGRNLPLQSPLLHLPRHSSQRPSSSPPGTTRHQAIATTYAQRSA
jgi:hypothetical protein